MQELMLRADVPLERQDKSWLGKLEFSIFNDQILGPDADLLYTLVDLLAGMPWGRLAFDFFVYSTSQLCFAGWSIQFFTGPTQET